MEDSNGPDYYTVPVTAGDLMVFETATPTTAYPAEHARSVSHALRLKRAQVAFDDNAADGRNVADRSHRVGVRDLYHHGFGPGQTGTATLAASGYTGTMVDPFEVQQSSIADGALLKSKPTTIDLKLDEPILLPASSQAP
ncbi:MAG: hypothetical protein R3C45_12510 [Phycisphaerales bacterium]